MAGRIASRAARGLLIAALAALSGRALAVSPTLWTVETVDDFDKGRPEGVAISAAGDLTLAPELRALKVPAMEERSEPFLWSEAVDSKGTLYVGGGNGGRIYRIPRGGPGTLYYETGDLAVHAMAVDRSDTLFAATSPQGKIYRITGEGKGEVYYQPEDRYIWALAISPKGELFAATGERGIIYRVPSKGKGEVYFDSDEFHIVSLAFDPAGALLAGSDGKGLLYRVTAPGKATVLYDAPLREINALAVDAKGAIYASAVGAEGEAGPVLPQPQATPTPTAQPQPQTGAPLPPPVPIPGVEAGATVTVTASATGAAPGGGPTAARSEVYRIDPDGTVATLWSSQDEVVYALLIDAAGRPVVGTGEPGRIRVLAGPQQSTLLAKLPESQVTALVLGPGRQLFAAASNVGRVYALDAASSESGLYLSETHDAETLAHWGRISWRAALAGGARVELSTRSGNSSVPDATWSDWSMPYPTPEGSAVSSPAARFVQWRARLLRAGGGGGSPTLKAVSIAYVQSNQAPTVSRVTVAPPGVVRERQPFVPEIEPAAMAFTGIRVNPDGTAGPGPSAAIPEKKVYVRGLRSVDWDAQDPNGDNLSFDLWFRAEDESAWKPLARGVTESYFAFDSMQLPDGLYRLRVDASDAPSNTGATAKTASLTSDPFLVDNTPPVVQVTARKAGKGAAGGIDVTVSDTVGPIARAEYSVDAASWVTLQPADGVNDSRSETYSATLDRLPAGEHTVIVKATDLLGNVGAGKVTFTSD